MTNTDRIKATLESVDAPICDDCLAMQAAIQPRQQVNQICRQLADHGEVDREQGMCTICGKAKIVNSVITSTNVAS